MLIFGWEMSKWVQLAMRSTIQELLHTRGHERITGIVLYPKAEEIGK